MLVMKVLFCHIGFMNLYNGPTDYDKPLYGGKYNQNNIGHEAYNFSNYNGRYYGFVQNSKSAIEVNRLSELTSGKLDSASDILVVWCAKRPDIKGVFVVGWYKHATVYRELQSVPNDVLQQRKNKEMSEFNVVADEAVLIPTNERTHQVEGIGRYAWYGNEETIIDVKKYIKNYEKSRNDYIQNISENFDSISGEEKEAIVKIRINHNIFRQKLLQKYNCTCCLSGCKINDKDLLIASHIKPWKDSDSNEKVNDCNGLLLCVMHDRLFDRGLISFDDTGKILISSKLSANNAIYSNIDKSRTIEVNSDNVEYLKYHRENIFIK